jgi:hypothetical protein
MRKKSRRYQDMIIFFNSKYIDKHVAKKLGDNCIVFENFTASIGDLMVAN